ncbi:MAG: polysaccharide biosynthesis protein [Paludibacteraceae bacterium]|nr:polysaccharide biosynthesis protein [Paludibacteraceae bacterium]
MIRHSGVRDITQIIKANLLVLALYFLLKLSAFVIRDLDFYLLSFPEMLFEICIVIIAMIIYRIGVKLFYSDFDYGHKNVCSNVIIYGAGSVGVVVNDALKQQEGMCNHVVSFVDDNRSKMNKTIDGIPILPVDEVLTPAYVKKENIDCLILAVPKISASKRQTIINRALNLNLKVKSVPAIESWIYDNFTPNQLENVKIEDLLERDPIVLNDGNMNKEIAGKIVLVTGAAGSIGSEIVRQIMKYNPKKIIALDQAETSLFDLQFEIKNSEVYKKYLTRIEIVIADVKDAIFIDSVFAKYHPDLIYHAAAYKHVPLMEENPYEATLINVFGTKVVAETAIKYHVNKFVMISTDKAVNPTNVMGATKRLAEIFVQSRSSEVTSFVTTRFGNVLGSNGSVIPLFHKQLALGGPLTVTHKDIIRYFMTIPEATSLVLEAGAIGHDGDIFVFDMGQPVKIYDMARNMIRLSKATGVEIKEIGLRPGEKLYEELLSNKENVIPTEHPKIMHAKVSRYERSVVDKYMEELHVVLNGCNSMSIVAKIKEFLPEYISNNSEFSKLDKDSV